MQELSPEVYDSLVDDRNWLRCLIDAGVDNWEGFDYAVELWEERYPGQDRD